MHAHRFIGGDGPREPGDFEGVAGWLPTLG